MYQGHEILGKAFTVALLITGTMELAETAVLAGISALDLADEWQEALLSRTIVASMDLGPEAKSLDGFDQPCAILPRELRSVMDLPPEMRRCFVLRVLNGWSSEVCADLLGLEAPQIEECANTAILRLACRDGCSAPS